MKSISYFWITFPKESFPTGENLMAEVKYVDLILKVRGDYNCLIVASDSRLAFLLQEKSASNP